MKEKIFAAAVVLLGTVAIGVAAKLGTPAEYLAAGGTALLLLANTLKPLLLADPKATDTEKK